MGLMIRRTSSLDVENNTIMTVGESAYGVYISHEGVPATNNTFRRNNISTTGATA